MSGIDLKKSAIAYNLAIGNSITGATAGSILFAGVAGILAQDNANLFFDDTNNRLGLGINSSLLARLHVKGSGSTNATNSLYITDSNAATNTYIKVTDDQKLEFYNNNGSLKLYLASDRAIIDGTNSAIRLSTNNTVEVGVNDTFSALLVSDIRTRANNKGLVKLFEETIGTLTAKMTIGNTTNYAGSQLTVISSVTGMTDTLTLKSFGGNNIASFKNGGQISFPNLPTSSSGLVAGDIWNNLGILTIV